MASDEFEEVEAAVIEDENHAIIQLQIMTAIQPESCLDDEIERGLSSSDCFKLKNDLSHEQGEA